MRGRIFDIQRFSIHDGPGIRTTVFLQGCPLSCPWCHNPESRPAAAVRVVQARCILCGACVEICPVAQEDGVTSPPAEIPRPDPARCTRCGACVEACLSGARLFCGREITIEETLAEVERDRPFYEESGGGVTFSGGEPLLQSEFLLACLRACRARGLHAAVDTSGFAPRATFFEIAAAADLVLFDIKSLDPERHLRWTGAPLEPILENLRALDEGGTAAWLRVPVVPGWNDTAEDLESIGRLAAGLRHIRRIHLLPYHRLAAEKHRGLGHPYPLEDVTPPEPGRLQAAAAHLTSLGLDARVGG